MQPIKYVFTSLEDMAEHFDRMAATEGQKSTRTTDDKTRRASIVAKNIWEEVARFIRNSEIDPGA